MITTIKLFGKDRKGRLVIANVENHVPTAKDTSLWRKFLQKQASQKAAGGLPVPPCLPRQRGNLL